MTPCYRIIASRYENILIYGSTILGILHMLKNTSEICNNCNGIQGLHKRGKQGRVDSAYLTSMSGSWDNTHNVPSCQTTPSVIEIAISEGTLRTQQKIHVLCLEQQA